MSNFSRVFYRVVAVLGVCFIAIIALFATGIAEPPICLDIYKDKNYEEMVSSEKNEDSSGQNYSGGSSDGSVIISTSNGEVDVNTVPSALKIKLSGNYLTAFKKASKTLSKTDTKSLILIKVGLQILQSNTIKYENALHFYSLDYKNSGSVAGAKSYSLKNCIDRINAGNKIYTDCFGFVRLTHSITCYTLNNSSPESVPGISGLYGWKGAYSEGKNIVSMKKLKSGAVIYDRLTGSGYGDRHVAMYLYMSGGEIVYMDQNGLKTGQFVNGSYIYSTSVSKPYKFNQFKNYN